MPASLVQPLHGALVSVYDFCPCRCAGGHIFRTQRKALQQGVDLVVGTPGRLCEHLQAGTLDLSACHTAVLDEADVLLADAAAFAEQVLSLDMRSMILLP